MIKYKKIHEIRIYSFLGRDNVPENKPKQIISDGWYLFGLIPIFTRENI